MNLSFFKRFSPLVVVALAWSMVGATPVQAQVQRAFAARYTADIRGDIVLTGNTVLRPISAAATQNNSQNSKVIDIDGDASTANSSSAQLKLPPGITGAGVAFARLYWFGRSKTALPTTQTIKFSATGSAASYQSYTATQNVPTAAESQLVNFTSTSFTGFGYVAWADITTAMQGVGTTPTLLAGGIRGDQFGSGDGLGDYAGWSVVVAYKNASDYIRQLRAFDGLAIVNGTTAVSTTISGFRTPDAGAFTLRFGSVVIEGDQGITGDALQFNGTALSDAVNPANDYFNSTVSQDGVLFNAELNPPPSNSSIFGLDADRTSLVGPSTTIPAAATSAALNFTTSGDVYFPLAFTTSIPTFEIQGRVFEDPNYSGGAGRAYDATKGMTGAVGARVELYNGTTGAFVKAATTDASGNYYFYTLGVGNFKVRVVNSSVVSNRGGGGTAGLVPVQTYRTDASGALDANGTGIVTPITGKVGGEFPSASDPAANSSGGLPAGLQSVTAVVLGDGAAPNIDFGFNFDSVVNTGDTGQGSLRQFVTNSNALSNTGLAQQGLTAGTETSIFMIPGAADPLGRPADARFANGVAKITLASTLQIIGANANLTAIDGTTQTTNIGDTNPGTYGTGGTVGTGNLALPTLARPEIEINGPRTVGTGLDIEAPSALVKNVSIWGFGGAGDSDNNAAIGVGNSAASSFAAPTITSVLLGAGAVPDGTGNLVPPNTYGSGDLVRVRGVQGGTITNSQLAYCGGKGVALRDNANNWTVGANEIRNNSRDNGLWDGIDAQSSGAQIVGNLLYQNGGNGIDSSATGTGATITNNTSRDNGQKSTAAQGEGSGIRLYGTGNSVTLNILSGNYFAGILVEPTATGLLSKNSIFNNGAVASGVSAGVSGQIGIDLLKNGDDQSHGTSPFVSPNDAGDGDAGGNGLLNFPVLTSGSVSGGNLTLQGFAPPGATVEVFVAQPDPTGFGQGKTYAFSFVEGSASDLDNTTGSYDAATLQTLGYSAATSALAGTETTANKFKVVVPAGVIGSNAVITATATVSNQTSEFSPVLALKAPAALSGLVYLDANANGKREQSEAGASLTGYFIKLVPLGGNAATTAVAVNADGTYTFASVASGDYTLVLDNNATLSDITPTVPPGYSTTEAAGGTRTARVGTTSIYNENFGLYAGFSLAGRVFEDNGLGGGTANDAVQNGGEAGIGGVTVTLKAGATVIATATTAPDGSYGFSLPASYSGQTLSVVETNATAYLSSGAGVGNTGGTYSLATDTISFPFNTANGALTGANFADVRAATLENDGAKIGIRGGSVTYPHVFTANTSGTAFFSLSQFATPAPGWSAALYLDANGNGLIDGSEGQIFPSTPINTSAGTKVSLIVVNYIPQNAPDGSQDKITLNASFQPAIGGTNPALPAQTLVRGDLTTVGPQSGLELRKVVDKSTTKSGDLLTYTMTYINTGNAPLTNLNVYDTTPAYTTFVSADYATPLPASLSGCTISAPSAGGIGGLKWAFVGALGAGARGTVTFVVRVN